MSLQQKVRVACVGGGWVTCHRHMPALSLEPRCELVGLVSRTPDSPLLEQAELKRKYGLRRFGCMLSDTWIAEETDLIVIGTPPDTHYELVMQALEMQKHVLVEKPFAMSVDQARRMIEAARTAGRMLCVVHNFQFATATLRARALLEKGALGELKAVFGFQSSNHERRLPSWYRGLPLGLFTDESPHLLYLMRAFTGNFAPDSVFVAPSLDVADNTPSVVSLSWLSDSGITGSIYSTFVSALSEWHFVLFGSKKTAIIDVFRDILVEVPNDRRHVGIDVLRTSISALMTHWRGVAVSGSRHLRGGLDYGNREVIRRVIAGILTQEYPEGISETDGYDVVKIMQTIRES